MVGYAFREVFDILGGVTCSEDSCLAILCVLIILLGIFSRNSKSQGNSGSTHSWAFASLKLNTWIWCLFQQDICVDNSLYSIIGQSVIVQIPLVFLVLCMVGVAADP